MWTDILYGFKGAATPENLLFCFLGVLLGTLVGGLPGIGPAGAMALLLPEMTPNHWEVVNFLHQYYDEYQIAPAVRVLTKAIGKQLGEEKGNSKYLYVLFPYGPAKQACKIAGLPKPTGCV